VAGIQIFVTKQETLGYSFAKPVKLFVPFHHEGMFSLAFYFQ
jgi:hypothetical protein